MAEAAPVQYTPGKALHLRQDRCACGGKTGNDLEQSIHIGGNHPGEAEGQTPQQAEYDPAEADTDETFLRAKEFSRLAAKGPKIVVITSVLMADGKMCNAGYDSKNNAYWRVTCDMIPKHYPGTGDLFASVLTGGLLLGDSLPIAMSRATSFCEHTIKTTFGYGTDPREGVMIEKCLPMLASGGNYTDYHAM